MAKVYLLCGKIASGKTTFAEAFCRENKAVILSYDQLMLLIFEGCLGDQHDQTVTRICQYFYQLSEQLIAADNDVILDFGYWKETDRVWAKAYFAARGIETQLVYFELPEAERLKRLKQRNVALAGATERVFLIGEPLREQLDAKFEALLANEADRIISD